MKFSFNARKWHAWLSFTVAVPILFVAITGLLMAHGQALGFRDIKVDASWLPGYSHSGGQPEVRALLRVGDSIWIGTQAGLVQKNAAGIQVIEAFEGQEIRALLPSPESVLVLTAQGLFAQRDHRWQKVSRAPIVNAYAENGVIYAAFRGKSLQSSSDGGTTWQPIADAQTALTELPPLRSASTTMMLTRVIRDIHTGEALLGHDTEWIWNDIVGGTMAFLAVTGLYLWWRGQRKLVFSRRVTQR